jgi:hypothetical protein
MTITSRFSLNGFGLLLLNWNDFVHLFLSLHAMLFSAHYAHISLIHLRNKHLISSYRPTLFYTCLQDRMVQRFRCSSMTRNIMCLLNDQVKSFGNPNHEYMLQLFFLFWFNLFSPPNLKSFDSFIRHKNSQKCILFLM